MISKEPFFDDNLITKPHFRLEPAAFKISPSTNYPLMVQAQPPLAPKSVRRPSREPYYQGNSWSSRSVSSGLLSYAKLSDIFDYRYLDQLRPDDNEEALVFDSDSDYEAELYTGNQKKELNKGFVGSKAPKRGSSRSEVQFETLTTYSDDDHSELEDYLVHMLTFKVNARAQYTQPPRSSRSMSVSSDNFDGRSSRLELDLPYAGHHPKFSAPRCYKQQTVIDCVLPPPNQDLEGYLDKCSNIFVDNHNERRIPAPKRTGSSANDDYCNEAQVLRLVRDDFDVRPSLFMV